MADPIPFVPAAATARSQESLAPMSARPGFRSERSDPRIDHLRVPPHSVEAEQAVLGGLMLAPESYDSVGDVLVEKDFYRRDHQLGDARATSNRVRQGWI